MNRLAAGRVPWPPQPHPSDSLHLPTSRTGRGGLDAAHRGEIRLVCCWFGVLFAGGTHASRLAVLAPNSRPVVSSSQPDTLFPRRGKRGGSLLSQRVCLWAGPCCWVWEVVGLWVCDGLTGDLLGRGYLVGWRLLWLVWLMDWVLWLIVFGWYGPVHFFGESSPVGHSWVDDDVEFVGVCGDV